MGHDKRRGYKSERLNLNIGKATLYAFRPNRQGFLRGSVDRICRVELNVKPREKQIITKLL